VARLTGLHLALNVAAMLITFLALLALVNGHHGMGSSSRGWFPYSLQASVRLGLCAHRLADRHSLARRSHDWQLAGHPHVLNEFVAFAELGTMKDSLDPRSFTIATFALCGFANFSSIGIQIGGIGALAPEQRSQLAKFGIRAMLAAPWPILSPPPSSESFHESVP